jgi:hypothetical protein
MYLTPSYKEELIKFIIEKRDGGYVIIHASKRVYPKVFNTVPSIIEHFQRERNGMPIRLIKPVKRKVLGFGVWEYQQGDGQWRLYTGKVNRVIEQALLENQTAVKTQISGHSYTVRLDTRMQHNHETGTWRKIRRRQVTTEYDEVSVGTDSLVSPRLKRSQTTSQTTKTVKEETRITSPGMGPRSKSFREMPTSPGAPRSRLHSFHSSASAYSSPRRTRTRPTSPVPIIGGQSGTLANSPSYATTKHRIRTLSTGEINPEVYKPAPQPAKARPGSPVPMARSSSLSSPRQAHELIKSRRPVLPRPHLASNPQAEDDESLQSNSASAFDADDESDSDEEHLLAAQVRHVSFTDPADESAAKLTECTVQFPSYWSTLDSSGKRPPLKLVPLLNSSMEYNRILNALLKSMPIVVQRIARVENIDLWEAYYRKRDTMQRRCREGKQVRERSLFHGTLPEYVGSICKQNFDFRLSGGQHGTAFGYGNYFAVSAARASNYCMKDENGSKHIFMCKVLVGDYTKGNPTLRRPPHKISTSSCYEMYDSVCDNIKEPTIFVVFDNDQAYPDYIITFR